MKDLLNQLNKEQQEAVKCADGPMIVIAGAGSGKTRVLTFKVANLLKLGVDPFSILALTFTNKAAREMKERIIKLVGSYEAKNVWMGTFHSIFARVLRIDGNLLGYPDNFTIYDTEDSKNVIKAILKANDLDPKVYNPSHIQQRISAAKNNLISPIEYNSNPEVLENDKAQGKPLIGHIFTTYNARCRQASAMDFDDLLFNMNLLLRDFPEVLLKYQHKFKYILVDEYQDTNYAQYLIVKQLSANNENICVVGDDAQSIYSFRGANIENILNFKRDYPEAKTFKLEQNYRSTKTIVNAANSIIKFNKNQIFKEIWTDNDEGYRIKILKASTDNEEGALVANGIFETKMNEQEANSNFAILYRTNAQSRAFEEALRKLNITYRIFGGLSFYKRKEIKDLLSYFRLAVNHKDQEALFRVINYPIRGIGKTTMEKVVVAADAATVSPWEVIEDTVKYKKLLDLNGGSIKKIEEFVTMIKSFSAAIKTRDAYDAAKHIAVSSGILKELYEDKTPEGISRFDNIEELLNAIKDFVDTGYIENNAVIEESSFRTLDMFMQDIALLTDADEKDEEKQDYVSLMTIHAAKGLEFPYIYIVGMEENLFPSIHSIQSRNDLEEERRLFYVALTRGMKNVTLSFAENRYRWGEMIYCEPSRFLDEIDERYIDKPQKKSFFEADFLKKNENSADKPKTSSTIINVKSKNLKRVDDLRYSVGGSQQQSNDSGSVQAGMQVEHERFGKGKILNVEGSGSNKKATVFFENVGQKQLLLHFAKLKIIN